MGFFDKSISDCDRIRREVKQAAKMNKKVTGKRLSRKDRAATSAMIIKRRGGW